MDDQNPWGPLTVLDWVDSLIGMLEERKKEILKYIYKEGRWHDQRGQQVQLKPNLSHIEQQQAPGLSGFMPAAIQQFMSQCAGQPIQRYSDLEKLGLTLDTRNQTSMPKPPAPNVSQIFQEKYQQVQAGRPVNMDPVGKNVDCFPEDAPTFLDVVEQAKSAARQKYQERRSRG